MQHIIAGTQKPVSIMIGNLFSSANIFNYRAQIYKPSEIRIGAKPTPFKKEERKFEAEGIKGNFKNFVDQLLDLDTYNETVINNKEQAQEVAVKVYGMLHDRMASIPVASLRKVIDDDIYYEMKRCYDRPHLFVYATVGNILDVLKIKINKRIERHIARQEKKTKVEREYNQAQQEHARFQSDFFNLTRGGKGEKEHEQGSTTHAQAKPSFSEQVGRGEDLTPVVQDEEGESGISREKYQYYIDNFIPRVVYNYHHGMSITGQIPEGRSDYYRAILNDVGERVKKRFLKEKNYLRYKDMNKHDLFSAVEQYFVPKAEEAIPVTSEYRVLGDEDTQQEQERKTAFVSSNSDGVSIQNIEVGIGDEIYVKDENTGEFVATVPKGQMEKANAEEDPMRGMVELLCSRILDNLDSDWNAISNDKFRERILNYLRIKSFDKAVTLLPEDISNAVDEDYSGMLSYLGEEVYNVAVASQELKDVLTKQSEHFHELLMPINGGRRLTLKASNAIQTCHTQYIYKFYGILDDADAVKYLAYKATLDSAQRLGELRYHDMKAKLEEYAAENFKTEDMQALAQNFPNEITGKLLESTEVEFQKYMQGMSQG